MKSPPQIELRPIDDLLPYARNARTHSTDQVQQLKQSMIEFGWTNPILADGAGIVAGHGRLMAAQELRAAQRTIYFPNGAAIPDGLAPVIDCSGWSAEQRRAYILADNKLALNAGWDTPMLTQELADLQDAGFDLGLTGFGEEEVEILFAGDGGGAAGSGIEDPPDDTYAQQYGVIIICGSEAEQQAVFAEMQAAGRNCKVVTT